MSTNTKVIKMMFHKDLWNSSRALRYVKKQGHKTIKRGIKKDNYLVYQIKKESDYENFRTITIDKARKVKAVTGTKKENTTEPEVASEPEITQVEPEPETQEDIQPVDDEL